MSYEFYKILHLISLIALFLSLGMLIVGPKPLKKLIMSLHGLALLFLFVSGFGLIAKLHIPLTFVPFRSPWIWAGSVVALFLIIPLINKKEKRITSKKYKILASYLLLLAALFPPSIIFSPSWFWKKVAVFVVLVSLTPLFMNKKGEPLTLKKATLLTSILLVLAFYAIWQVTYR